MSVWRLDCSAALTAWLVLTGCSSDPGEGEVQSQPGDAGASRATSDTGTVVGSSAGAASDGSVTSPSSACGAGKVWCDDSCIDAIAVSGSALVERVFAKSCGFASSCHGGTSPKEGLALDTVDHMVTTAVARNSKQLPARKLVEPGNADESYLVDKLLGRNLQLDRATGDTSTVMPQPPSDRLCAAKIDAVRSWIQAGAPR